jgi:hypothetical protein
MLNENRVDCVEVAKMEVALSQRWKVGLELGKEPRRQRHPPPADQERGQSVSHLAFGTA